MDGQNKEPKAGDGSALGDAMADDKHFVRALVGLGDAMTLVAVEPIRDADGAKVVDAGCLIDSRLYSAIAGRMLSKPLVDCVKAARPARREDLWSEGRSAMSDERFYRMLGHDRSARESIKEGFAEMRVPERIGLRLSMAKERMPVLYAGSVRRALVCAYLAHMLGWPSKRIAAAAAAGVALDLGMLHVDPSLLAARKRLTGAERRHVFAHPLIGMICAKDAGMSKEQCDAVAQHHERLDGGGYPMGLDGVAMGAMSRIAQLASAAVGMLERSQGAKCEQLHLALRLNAAHFDGNLSRWLMEPIERALAEDRRDGEPPESAADGELAGRGQGALARLEAAAELVDRWSGAVEEALADGADAKAMQPFYDVDQRMGAFKQALADAGAFGDQLRLLGAVDDEADVGELERLGAEASWQMASMGHEAARRWPEWTAEPNSARARGWLDAIEAHARAGNEPGRGAEAAEQAKARAAASPTETGATGGGDEREPKVAGASPL